MSAKTGSSNIKPGDAEIIEGTVSSNKGTLNGNLQETEMDWWPELADLDRLNVMAAPIEDRARILAAKIAGTVEETMLSISERSMLPYLESFTIADAPT